MADEQIKVVEPKVIENPPVAPAPAVAPAVVTAAPVVPVASAPAPAAVVAPVKENPPAEVAVVAPAPAKADVPTEENPKIGMKAVWDTSLVKGPSTMGLPEVAGAVAGWYVSGLIGYQLYKMVKPLGPQFQYRNVVDHVIRIVSEPVGGIVAGSLLHLIGGWMGKGAQAEHIAKSMVLGAFVRGGVDAVDTAIGFARGSIIEPSGDMMSNFVGMGNILDLSGLKTSADIHDSHLENTAAMAGAEGGEFLDNPTGLMGTEDPYSGAQEQSTAGAGSLVDWATL